MKLLWLVPCAAILVLLSLPFVPAAASPQEDTERMNKAIVARFVARINSSEDADIVARQVAPLVIQHDALTEPGRKGTAAWIRELRARVPREAMKIKHLLADGDMVFVHSQVAAVQDSSETTGINRYDFYRLDHGTIVEHWVVKAPVPGRSASGNSVFSDLYAYPFTPPVLDEGQVEMNRLLVKNLSQEVFGRRNFALLDRMWASGYIQHNPRVDNGRAALASVIEYIARPGASYRVVRSMADGDLAVVCSHNVAPGADPRNEFAGTAVCDMYRVANFELVEHWDVAQPVPTSSLNGNSMFSALYRKGEH